MSSLRTTTCDALIVPSDSVSNVLELVYNYRKTEYNQYMHAGHVEKEVLIRGM